MRFFYFLGRKFSYTFALVFFTIPFGWFGGMFGYFLGTSYMLFEDSFIVSRILIWLPFSILLGTLLHYIQFGFLTPFKIPALTKPLRVINRYFRGSHLDTSIETDELKQLYNYVIELPLYNTITTVFYVIMAGIVFLGLLYFDLYRSGRLEPEIFKIVYKMTGIGISIAWLLYGIAAYLVGEIITGRERATCYNELHNRGILIPPRSMVSISLKFGFFVILMMLILLTFAALMEKGRLSHGSGYMSIAVYFIFAIVTGVSLMLVNTNTILRNLKEMNRVARAIATGADVRFDVLPLDREFSEIEFSMLEMGREINEFRKNLEIKVDQRTQELQSALSDLKEKDDLIQKQLDIASTIQRGILPGKIDDWNELKFSVRYIAMEKIGGDFYDIYNLKGDKIGLLVADVSGHGIPAALVTTMAKISFGNACMLYDSPRKIFQEVNQSIIDHVKTQDYLTCFFVNIDDEYNVTYSNASHQKAIHLKRETSEIELLDTNGLFIGAIEDAREIYEEKTTRLEYGDRLILYTDGIPEAIDESRKEYSVERLQKIIMENRNLPLDDFTSSIIEDVQRFIGSHPIEDDITIIVIELSRDDAIDIIKRSKKLVDSNRYYEAIEQLEDGLKRFPDNLKLIYNLSKNYLRANEFEKTIEFIKKYLEMDTKNKFVYYIGGAAYYQLEDYGSSIEYFGEAIRLDANFVNVHYALGMAYKKYGAYAEAIGCFEKVLALDIDHKMALYELNELRKSKNQ